MLRQSGAQEISRTSEAEAEFDASDRPHRRRDSAQKYEADFEKNFASFYRELGAFEEFAPVYDWGFRKAKDLRYRDQTFEKAEPDLKQVLCLVNPSLEWAQVAMLVLYGWEQAGGKIRQSVCHHLIHLRDMTGVSPRSCGPGGGLRGPSSRLACVLRTAERLKQK